MWNTRLSELAFDGEELRAAIEAIASEWITSGARTRRFEDGFARIAGTTEAVAVSSGTAALFLALKAAGIGPGDEVLCPSLTFAATAAAIVHCGATPVFVDIASLEDPTMDPVDAACKVTARTRALLPVHYAGIPCDMDALGAVAAAAGLAVVEDAAHAPGARYRGRPAGSLGTAGCFSLFGNKNITTGEGGVVTTSDPELASRLRRLRSHGMTTSSWDREQGRPAQYDVVEIGFNFRFDDIRAAIGLAQLKKLHGINRRRRELADAYAEALAVALPDVIRPFGALGPDRAPVFHIYPVVFPDMEARDRAEARLREQRIQTSIHYRPVHQLSAFRPISRGVSLPRTEAFGQRELTLPLYPKMTLENVRSTVEQMAGSLAPVF